MAYKKEKQHIAEKFANLVTAYIKNKNNGQTLLENECNEFAELFRIELLKDNGYE